MTNYCANCGQAATSPANNCSNCGTPLAGTSGAANGIGQVIVGLFMLVAVVLLVGSLYGGFFRKGDARDKGSCGSAMDCLNRADEIFESKDVSRLSLEEWRDIAPMYHKACSGAVGGEMTCQKAALADRMIQQLR